MLKIWLVFKREYLVRVRTKAFILTTLALPVLTIAYFVFVVAIAKQQMDRTLKIAILDSAGGLAGPVARGFSGKLPNGQPAFTVVRTDERPGDEDKLRAELRAQVQKGQLDGYLVIPGDVLESKGVEFHTRNPGDLTRVVSIREAVNQAIIARRFSDRGVHFEDLGQLIREVNIKLVKVSKQGESEEKGQTLISALIMIMFLYMTLVIYGVTTMRSVLEEKTTRVVEILVSSLRPFQLLAGKILGVAAVALTQYLIWMASAGLLAGYGVTMAAAFRPQVGSLSLHLPAELLVSAVLFFLAGYLLYASLFAAVGAAVSSEQDAQQYQLPVVLPIVLSVVLFNVILRDPNSTRSIVLSMIPFFAPVLMVLRIALQTPPLWQVALCLAIMALTTAGVVWFSARIYRVGLLMYGKRPSVVELLRWLRYT